MPHTQAPGIDYTIVAREWRCKWSRDNDKKSGELAQKAWEAVRDETKALDGVVRVQRMVCCTCMDYKIIVSMDAEKYEAWKARDHAPEGAFLEALRGIEGVTGAEAQLYSIEEQ